MRLLRLVFYGVGQRAFVLKDLSKVSKRIHPAATCWAMHEMLAFVRGLVAEPPSDVFAARDVGHMLPDLNATTVSSPVCKSLSLTTLCGFLDFRTRGLKCDVLAVAIGARDAVDRSVLCAVVRHHSVSLCRRERPLRKHRLDQNDFVHKRLRGSS